ncbi:anti-sigma factor family protein [Nonomuraea sp. SYSU D8015]|uniref:anti-sigma factor family protein n=1 Tax=Nonomuraea sp. SYSU D8015 TaxID=2593644 RepID=UPI0016608689|nr:hypothetical protein [Nonomuraea sp. SYSU D8015]
MMAHLTMEELAACANGAPGRDHLAACEACQAEVRRWQVVAEGVRQAAPAYLPPPQPLRHALAAIDGAPVRRRRVGLLSAAAAVVLAGTAAYALGTADRAVDPSRPVTVAAVYSTDCPDLKVAAGKLTSVSGSTMVLTTAGGMSITVRAGVGTKITHQVTGDLGELAEGTHVMVRGEGTEAGDTIRARQVAITPDAMKLPGLPNLGDRFNVTRRMAANGTVMGSVIRDGQDGFTVRAGDGTEVRVVTTTSTRLIKQESTVLGGLQTGEYTVAVGALEDDGTLSARTVQQNALTDEAGRHAPALPSGLRDRLPEPGEGLRDLPPLPDAPPEGLSDDLFDGLGCDADAIAGTAVYGAGA